MIELPLIFLGGLLGSAHCVGMCGGFALSIGVGTRGVGDNLRRQAVYTLGRVTTYAFLGVAGGYSGAWLAHRSGAMGGIQAALALAAGILLVVQGLRGLAVGRWRGLGSTTVGGGACLAGSFVGPFLASPRLSNVLVAGVLTGFLPCGLVYGYLSLAGSTASVVLGPLTMAAFGAGTAPLMMLTGAGGSLLSRAGRRRLLRVSAACVLLTGAISLARGAAAARSALADPASGTATAAPCPFCAPRHNR